MARKRAAAQPSETVTIRCDGTGVEVETTLTNEGIPSLPKGWKRFGDKVYSTEYCDAHYVTRGITLQVASVVRHPGPAGGKHTIRSLSQLPEVPKWTQEESEAAWRAFRADLRISWERVTQASNWYLHRIAGLDTAAVAVEMVVPKGKRRKKGSPPPEPERKYRLPCLPIDTAALDALAKQAFPDLYNQSLYSVRQRVVRLYRKYRWHARASGRKSIPTIRYPAPLPIERKDYTLLFNEQHQVFALLPVGEPKWDHTYLVRLKDGHSGCTRKVRTLEQVARGELASRAMSIRQNRKGDILVTFAVDVPKRPFQRDKVLVVRTVPNRLWECQLFDAEEQPIARPFLFNEDGLRFDLLRIKEEQHALFLQRFSEDAKYEHRYPWHTRRAMNRARATRCDRHNARVLDRIHKVSCSLAAYAARNRVSHVVYDDTSCYGEGATPYIPGFPWARLKTLVKTKLEAYGIEMVANEDPQEDSPDDTTQEES